MYSERYYKLRERLFRAMFQHVDMYRRFQLNARWCMWRDRVGLQ